MKKSILLAVVIIATGFITGCSSVPKHYNMTGTWKYNFEETGKDGVQTGSMTIAQESYNLRGTANDYFGEFNISGSISETSPTFLIEGRRNDGKRSFRLNGTLSSDDQFEGTYTTDQKTSGTIKGTKMVAD